MLPRDELRRITLVAQLYYDEGKTQDEIARHLELSRPKVSRLLKDARQKGIVQIKILDPFAIDTKLATALCKATGLERAVVVPGEVHDVELSRRRLGIAAARFLEETIQEEEILGVGWGRTLHATVAALESHQHNSVVAVPLLGGLGQIAPGFQVQELTRRIAETFNGIWRQLYIPAIVEDEPSRASLLASRDVKDIMDEWGKLTAALIGIGNVDFDAEMQMLFSSYLDEATQRRLRAAGAVGDICMRFFDGTGNLIPDGLRGVISVELEQLRKVPRVIAVAGGAEKAEAISGALRGGYVDILVTDEAAARATIELMENG